jgi:hypothetical protein
MRKMYSIEVPICATAYIKAHSPQEALAIANNELADTGVEFSNGYQSIGEAVCMDGRPYSCLFDNEEDVALSPAVTFTAKGFDIFDIDTVEIEEQEK